MMCEYKNDKMLFYTFCSNMALIGFIHTVYDPN